VPLTAATLEVSATSSSPVVVPTADAAASKQAPLTRVHSTASGAKSAAPVDYNTYGGRK
jgi:hypothetical protein